MKILVTGSTGVIGRRLVPLLCQAGHDVTGVARSSIGRTQLESHGARAADVDLFDSAAVARAVDGCDTVINLATHIPHTTAVMFLPWAWRENDRLRRIASVRLVDASIAAGVRRFIQESFAPVYPDRSDSWIDESTPIKPVRYNRTVADAEAAADRFSQHGGTGIVVRFGAFYGRDATQLSDLIRWIRRGWSPLPGSPRAFISSVSHDDAASAVAAVLRVPAGIYNVVDNEPVTHQAYGDSLADALGVAHPKLPPSWVTPLFGSLGEMLARSLKISNRKLRASSGWAPEYPSVRQGWAAILAGPGERRDVSGGRVPLGKASR